MPIGKPTLRIPHSKNHLNWLKGYDESRAIRDVKRGRYFRLEIPANSKPFLILNSSF